MKRNKALLGWIVLLIGLLMQFPLLAKDISNVSTLRTFLSAGGTGNEVILSGNKTVSEVIKITNIEVIINLNGYTLTSDQTDNGDEAIGIEVGTSAKVTIKGKNANNKVGTISVKAQDGGFWALAGENAVGIYQNGGSVDILDLNISVTPGKKWGAYYAGTGYTLKSSSKIGNMIPYGVYISGASTSTYNNTSYPGVQESVTTTVSLITYTVNYDPNNGTIKTAGTSSYTIETTGFTLPTAERNGYTLSGWTYDGSSVNVSSLPTTTSRDASQTLTFTAAWTPITYSIKYVTNGGDAIKDSSYTIVSDAIELPTPTWKGYYFKGWYTTEIFSGDPVTSIPKGSTGNQTFYAKWITLYSITYELNDGTQQEGEVPTSFTKESETITLPTTPTRRGYTFEGWFNNEKCEGTAIESIATGTTGNQTFFAKWAIIYYNLTWHLDEGTNPEGAQATYTVKDEVTFPTPTKAHYDFAGWYDNEALTGDAITSIAKGTTEDKEYYAKWTATTYMITFVVGEEATAQESVTYTIETATFKLPQKTTRTGYSFAGWYDNEKLSGEAITSIEQGTTGDKKYYAKWNLEIYTIEYDCYYGTNPSNARTSYTVLESVTLPVPSRSGFTFVGWHPDDMLKEAVQTEIPVGTTGNKTFYAEWTAGNAVQITSPENGTITVKEGTTVVKSGGKVGAGTSLVVTATPSSGYSLSKLVINNTEYTSSPQTVTMPATGGLTISASFVDNRQSASAPKITTDPANTDYIPLGETVKVTLEATGTCDSLLYSIDGSTEKRYTGVFEVGADTTQTVTVKAIARRAGYKDGTTERNIIFRSGKVTITFDLPKGITAHNPEGGEVVEAVATGGTFEFKLTVDKSYFETLDSLKVTANGKVITPNASGVYTLSNQTANVTVVVTGISGVTHVITLVQSTNGTIAFTDDTAGSETTRTVNHGDNVSVTATPDTDYKFQSWTDGETANPRTFTAEADVTLQARFVRDTAGYSIILPELEGVKVRALTGYSTEVKPGGKFKFYLRLDDDYSNSVPVVYANDEVLEVYQEVYSLYDIEENIRISVDGIVRNKTALALQDSVSAYDLETGAVADTALYSDAMVLLKAVAPEGQVFSKWNDGKTDNPRIVTVAEASQMFPLFLSRTDESTVKVSLPILTGAGMAAVSANVDAVAKGDSVQLKLVILPAYSQSAVYVTANGTALASTLSLRSSTETKTLFYTLPNVTEDMTVEVSGLELNQYTVSLEQQSGGTVTASQTGTVRHGTVLTLKATPNRGNMFVKWNDGNTLNPYSYVVTGDCTLSGRFAASDVAVGNESVALSGIRIYSVSQQVYVQTDEPVELSIYNLSGQRIRRTTAPAGTSSYPLPDGIYFVKAGTRKAVKVTVW